MGSIAVPRRRVRGGPKTGQTVEVTTPDHVLIQMEFANGALGQLLASFGTPETLAPWLELHCTGGTVSFGGKSWELDAPVSVYTDDETDAATEGWANDVEVSGGRIRSGRDRRPPLRRVPAGGGTTRPHRRARPPRARHHPHGLRVDRRRSSARDDDDLLKRRVLEPEVKTS